MLIHRGIDFWVNLFQSSLEMKLQYFAIQTIVDVYVVFVFKSFPGLQDYDDGS